MNEEKKIEERKYNTQVLSPKYDILIFTLKFGSWSSFDDEDLVLMLNYRMDQRQMDMLGSWTKSRDIRVSLRSIYFISWKMNHDFQKKISNTVLSTVGEAKRLKLAFVERPEGTFD